LRHNTDVRRLKNGKMTSKDIERTVRYYEFYEELKDVLRLNKAQMAMNNAFYREDIERVWSLMPELRNTDACYDIFEAVHEKIRLASQK